MKKRNLSIRKFDGDDVYSYAVFRTEDIKKYKSNVIFWGEATPLISGLGKKEAQDYKSKLESYSEIGK